MSLEITPSPLDVRHIAAAGLTEPPGATWSNALVVGREVVLSGVTARGADGAPIGGQAGSLVDPAWWRATPCATSERGSTHSLMRLSTGTRAMRSRASVSLSL